jgi:hypothetical protein
MSWIRLPGALSASPVVINLERRFGLIGYARLLKMLELLAVSPTREEGTVAMPLSDWLDALQAPHDELFTLLNALRQSSWLNYSHGDDPGSPLVVDFLQADSFLPESTPILLQSGEQWAFWCETELNMPRHVTGDPYTQQLFRRWCASNVTVTEMLEACEAATKGAVVSLSPDSLHTQLQAVRGERLKKARS